MEQWMNYAEQIRQETGLPIICVQTSRVSVDQLLLEHQERGWELSAITEDDSGAVWLIFIESLSWHESARALLRLFFTPQATRTGGSVINQVSAWLHSICHGSPISPPARLEQLWSWREPRAVFLMEHSRWESVFEWQTLQPLLQDFFKGEDSSFLGIPLGRSYYLLLVPISILGNQNDPEDLLEWASGLHDLVSTEQMEHVRLLVSRTISTPLLLGKALQELLSLSHALTTFRPRTMVAGSWQYPLEQWAQALPSETRLELLRSLPPFITAHTLNAEQIETLETLFHCQWNISDTARQLYVHRNTLLYRLDKLTEQTGLDPRQFPHAILFRLLLLFRQN
ncbi:helix-turn-helix domain-containing protein [Brevibacillus centrosporus]|uniref:PucR family transcriptional regulator n=1 Tax=Brevibacillus centrosporus TaxID=54910 RepID=UPI000F0A6FE5|nr:helix-turn-helix domain-containing protein [Brevibacillus centrosporus]MEC2132434.1 helix-turn-helix domain-containing protein [Brevibacillus centrosporus]MED4908533.1 helix-turn-helix domain-containing protein [Brevibacillus centrosporus]RNB69808.1 PucR family transcriptional regulator [Brevibacillus centrosporus]GED29737.1 hypothetical protein BCE02nite_08780 [Brevibacillus centrosporus]